MKTTIDKGLRKIKPPKYVQRPKPPKYVQRPKPARQCTNNSNNLPAHYNIAGIDTMNLILTICEHNNTDTREGFYLANTLKYLIRYKNKNGLKDLDKAKDYLNRLIEYTTIESLPSYNVDGQGD